MPLAVPLDSHRIVTEALEKSQNVDQVGWKRKYDEQLNLSTLPMVMNEVELASNLWKRIEGCHCTFIVFENHAEAEPIAGSGSLPY